MSPARGANLMRHHHHQHPVVLFPWPVGRGGGRLFFVGCEVLSDYTQVRMHAGSDGLR